MMMMTESLVHLAPRRSLLRSAHCSAALIAPNDLVVVRFGVVVQHPHARLRSQHLG